MADETSPINGNGITKYKVEELVKSVSDLTKRVEELEKELISTRIERAKEITTAKEDVERKVDELKEDVGDIQVELATIGSRLTLFQGAQAIFTTIAGVVASIVGRLP